MGIKLNNEELIKRFSERQVRRSEVDSYLWAIQQRCKVPLDAAEMLLWNYTSYPFGDYSEVMDCIESIEPANA